MSEESGWIELAGQRVRLGDVRAHPHRYGRLLADARATRSAVCLCRPARLRLVTRRGLGGRHHVACWPHEGPDHAPGCAFFHLQPELSGRAGYTSSAIQESADGASIRFHAALVTRSARRGVAGASPTTHTGHQRFGGPARHPALPVGRIWAQRVARGDARPAAILAGGGSGAA